MCVINCISAPCHQKDESSSPRKIFFRQLLPSSPTSDIQNCFPNFLDCHPVQRWYRVVIRIEYLNSTQITKKLPTKIAVKSRSSSSSNFCYLSSDQRPPFVQSTNSATFATQVPCHQFPPSVLDVRWYHHRNNTLVLSQIIIKSQTSSSSNFRFRQINDLRNSSVVSSVRLHQYCSNFKVHQLWTPIHLLHHLQIMKSRKTKKQFTKGQCQKEKNAVLAVGSSVWVRK